MGTPPAPAPAPTAAPASRPALADPSAIVVAALKAGLEADLDEWIGGTAPDAKSNAHWGADRTLTASFIARLCGETNAPANPYPRGIRIKGARIVDDLDLSTGAVGALLLLQRCRIEGNISLRDATTKLLNLAESCVCGSIDADRMRSTGGVYLRDGFRCEKSVRLSAAVITGDLDCRNGTIEGAEDVRDAQRPIVSLRCDRASVTGSVFFVNFTANGEVRLLDATVGANVVSKDATFGNAGTALLADNAKIAGSLILGQWKRPPRGAISVRNAAARALHLGKPSDTPLGKDVVRAQGFRYETIAGDGAVDLSLCMRWLDALIGVPFNPQPYEQCAKVLRDIGLPAQAKDVAILRRRVERKLGQKSASKRFGSWLLDVLVRYGYRPERSVFFLLVLTFAGAVVFHEADRHGGMVPSDAAAVTAYLRNGTLPVGYPRLNSVVYSLDVLLPIIDFQQDSKWRPYQDATMPAGSSFLVIGGVAMWTMRILIAAGWILSTLLVASVTGLIRKD